MRIFKYKKFELKNSDFSNILQYFTLGQLQRSDMFIKSTSKDQKLSYIGQFVIILTFSISSTLE